MARFVALTKAKIITLIIKYQKVLKYLVLTLLAALAETILGWILLITLHVNIVIVNVIAVSIVSIIHYALTMTYVFKKGKNYKTLLVYVISFFVGIFLQSIVIWFFYEVVLARQVEFIRYSLSKGISLVTSFCCLYKVRSIVFSKFM